MLNSVHTDGAVTTPNQFIDVGGRTLAYRSIGTGKPIVLCSRFRGNLDTWDPAFLDALADNGLRVITFDYSGLGLSTGERSMSPLELSKDACALMDALQLENAVIGGWSLGGLAAQIVLAMNPHKISHVVLIATSPPGPLVKTAEQLFYDVARKPENDLEDNVILFFEPRSSASREAARRSMERIERRREGRSPPIPIEWAAANLGANPRNPIFPADGVLTTLKKTQIPILHIGGDHDIIFPIENWYALNQQLPTLQLLTYPSVGHAPHHEHPEATASHIASFIKYTR